MGNQISSITAREHKPIAIWLFICAIMVALMVAVGGYTRLTHSGLSIVEWRPITGTLPPLNAEDWQQEFLKYQHTPEYIKINHDLSINEFKKIYLIEYTHRLLGRIIGLVFALPMLYYLMHGQISNQLLKKLAIILVLGALQGGIGWFMVKSGLHSQPHVSQYRLALHLGMAFIIFSLILWSGFELCSIRKTYPPHPLFKLSLSITLLIFLQAMAGAMVAGLNAGLIYDTFPLMDGHIIPPGLFNISPWYLNFFENVTTVQFVHRLLALIIFINILYFAALSHKIELNNKTNNSILMLVIALFIQLGFGVATLLYHVPLALALMHQVWALALFSIALYVNWSLYAHEAA